MQLLKQFILLAVILFLFTSRAAANPALEFSSVPTITGPLVVGQTYIYDYVLKSDVTFPVPISFTIAPGNSHSSMAITNNTCPSTVPNVGTTCTFKLAITPTMAGLLNDSVVVHVNARNGFSPDPSLVSVASITNVAYVANYSEPSVSTCTINAQGALTGCSGTSTLGVVAAPVALTLNPAQTFAYLTSDSDNHVYQCAVNNGAISNSCVATGSGFSSPYSIAFNAPGTLAYVANELSGTVSKCTVGSDGSFSNCVNSGATGLSRPYEVVLNAQGTIAYVADKTARTVFQCPVVSGGQLNGCTNAVSGYTLGGPTAIAFSPDERYAYVVDYNNSNVVRFAVQAGGLLDSGQVLTIPTLSQPYSIALFPADATHTFAYIVDEAYGSQGATFSCTVGADGSFTNCSNPPVTANFDFPKSIFI